MQRANAQKQFGHIAFQRQQQLPQITRGSPTTGINNWLTERNIKARWQALSIKLFNGHALARTWLQRMGDWGTVDSCRLRRMDDKLRKSMR